MYIFSPGKFAGAFFYMLKSFVLLLLIIGIIIMPAAGLVDIEVLGEHSKISHVILEFKGSGVLNFYSKTTIMNAVNVSDFHAAFPVKLYLKLLAIQQTSELLQMS